MALNEQAVAAMMAATQQAGATAQPAPVSADTAIDDGAVAEGTEEGEAGEAEQAAQDPLKELFGGADEARKAKQELENLRAMQRESHERNREARTLRDDTAAREARMEKIAENAERALETNRTLVDTIVRLRKSGNSELANQLFDMFGEQIGDDPAPAPARRAAAPAVDPRLDELQTQVRKLAFGLSHRDVVTEVMSVANRLDILKGAAAQKLGIGDRVMRAAIDALYAQDAKEPGSVNPMDPARFRAVVEATVKAEAKFYEDLNDANVKDYRAKKKELAGKAAPSTQGASAGVRVAPNPAAPGPRLPLGKTAWRTERERQMLQAGLASKPRAAEV